jgi:ABC-2 type transport system permease protein
MRKFWLVFKNEYLRHVLRKRFLFALASLPFFAVLSIGIGFLAVSLQRDSRPIGYVDRSGLFANAQEIPHEEGEMFGDPEIRAFPDEAAASEALNQKSIQAYFVIDAGYMQNGDVQLVALKNPNDQVQSTFDQFLMYNLLNRFPADVRDRLMDNGMSVEVRSMEGSRQMKEDQFMNILIPLLAGVFFMVAVNTSGSYLMQALVEEKENRTMEIVVTSISPQQLMAGKILGNMCVGLTQLLVWLLFGGLCLWFTAHNFDFGAGIQLDGQFVWLTLAALLPAFALVSALMATVGISATEAREAQQVAGLFTLPIFIPYWFVSSLMTTPNSPLAIGMSLFPLTAPVSLPMRAVFTPLPAWQIIVSLSLLVACAAGAFWLAGRAFRIGMLRYGKRLSLKELFARA